MRTPEAAISRTRPSMRWRAEGSRPFVGSSSKQQLRSVRNRLRELGELLHSERIGLELAVARLAEADVEQRLVRPFERRPRRQAGKLGHHAHEADRREAGDERLALRHVAETLPHRAGLGRDVAPEDARPAGRGRVETEDGVEQRGLAGAVGPQQTDHLAGERSRETLEDRSPCQADFQPFELEQRCGHRHPELYACGPAGVSAGPAGLSALGASSNPPRIPPTASRLSNDRSHRAAGTAGRESEPWVSP
jgi:hypothetical protein